MRLRPALAVLAASAVALLGATAAQAVVGGAPDGNAHPAVGGLVADQPYSDGTSIYCSGSLISPTVFLTAAHCGDGPTGTARVTFSTAYQVGDPVYAGTFHADPAFATGNQGDPHDIAVVVFPQPIEGITPVQLPTAGSESALAHGTPIVGVGYGAYAVTNGPGGHSYLYNDVRMAGTGSLNSVTPSWLRISENSARGYGGGCFGDSGGPNFLGTSNLQLATTITGDSVCRSTNTAYRLDSPAARAFLASYVRLP